MTNLKESCGIAMPPEMPQELPALIGLLTKNVPSYCKPAVASAVFPALAAHLHGVKFRYWDNVDHEATFMNVLIGRQSVGKGCIKKPVELIMEDIRLRESEWKEMSFGMKMRIPRPKDICIQMLGDNLTDAAFNQRIIDANNNGQRYVYTLVDEIDALKKVTTKRSPGEVGLLIRKAFDNAPMGQERVGGDAVTGIAPLRWNFNASTTPTNAYRFLSTMVNDGTLSRLDLSTIIRDEKDLTAPVMGIYDEAFANELKPYIEHLEAANGHIGCEESTQLALAMRDENEDRIRLYESEAYRVLSYRANVIAWLKGMVLYVANGCRWEEVFDDFIRWSQEYDLWCKMLYFGQQLENELDEEAAMQRQRGPKNLLNLLPDVFTREQYRNMRQSRGKKGDGETLLRVWMNRKYIIFDGENGNFCKTDEYIRKFKLAS